MARGFHLTIDEWFYHWFADEEKYKEVVGLFIKIFEVCDKIVIKNDTPLARKFYQLEKESGRWLPQQREAVNFIRRNFYYNSNKVHLVDDVDEFDTDINNRLPHHDVYLVEICFKTDNKILITTDATLHSNVNDLRETLSITSFMADDFIKRYTEDATFLET